ncbi:MAG: SH3 domain-containing protein, partial [Lachnospiraceae bacterium]|nr:SH3 domain-containing protein [Lachnospiraceae bacterium]
YKEICLNKPELFTYMSDGDQEVRVAAGGILASQINENNGEGAVTADGNSVVNEPDGNSEPEEPSAPVPTGPVYATATTTVNVRSSDSEAADKLGKVSGGTRVEVLEQKANGWSRIVYENGEGYIKSEFLNVAQSAAGVETIGTVTATANVNVRVAPNETAEKLGIAAGGETLDLVGVEGDWSKIIYNGQIGYVKSEYMQ